MGDDPTKLTTLSGWGRTRTCRARLVRSADLVAATEGARLTRGLGRSYGDASLPDEDGARVVDATAAGRVLDFDAESGRLRAEAGLGLEELGKTFLPRGFFTPVTPGTRFVTLGGMVAADVHGKNHHRDGSLGGHVRGLRIRTGDGRVVDCGPDREPELFSATLGGMGLLGHVLEVDLQLERVPTPWIWQEIERLPDLGSVLDRLREASRDWHFTVGWADLFVREPRFGRGVVLKGRWAEPGEAPNPPPGKRIEVPVPFNLPEFALNRLTGRAFYEFYYRLHGPREGIVSPDRFFYPLDSLRRWDRGYGRRGLIQYQFVLPPETPDTRIHELLAMPVAAGHPPMLVVIKDFGAEGRGTISFPRPGLTVAIDMPYRGEDTQRLVDRMNDLVAAEGGRIYLAKDALTRPEHFRAMEPRLAEWSRIRSKWDPERNLRSALSARLLDD